MRHDNLNRLDFFRQNPCHIRVACYYVMGGGLWKGTSSSRWEFCSTFFKSMKEEKLLIFAQDDPKSWKLKQPWILKFQDRNSLIGGKHRFSFCKNYRKIFFWKRSPFPFTGKCFVSWFKKDWIFFGCLTVTVSSTWRMKRTTEISSSPLGSVRKSIWQENFSTGILALSSKCGARMFFALTETR